MTAKEYLMQIKNLINEIKSKESELFLLECIATGTTTPPDKEAVQTSGVSDKVGNFVVKMTMMQKDILEQKAEAFEQISECISVIEKVKELPYKTAQTQYIILHKKYVGFKKLNQIAREENYSYDYIRDLHCVALRNVEKLMPKSQLPTPSHLL